MKITWYGHSCFKVSFDGGSVVFDPYADGSVPGWTLPQLSADAVLCSHRHDDHAGAGKVTLSGREPDCKVETVECFHDAEHGAKRGANTIHILTADGVRVAHLGDLGHEPDEAQLAAIGAPDVLLMPVGGFYTIDAATAAAVAEKIGARITVPMHYRGDGFGYDVIGTVEEFTALRKDVRCADSNSFDPAEYKDRVTLVLKAPK